MTTEANQSIREELVRRLTSTDFLVHAVHSAAKMALEDHKRTGDPIAGWRNEHVEWILAKDIVVEEVSQ